MSNNVKNTELTHDFYGWNFAMGSATIQVNVNGRCISLHCDNSNDGSHRLKRFSLAIFETEDRVNEITYKAFNDSSQWIDSQGKEVYGTLENFLAAIEWCKNN